MKLLFAFAMFSLLSLAGCASPSGGNQTVRSDLRPANDPSVSPPGTDVGTSFPGVNQGTSNTTATRSDSPPRP